MNILFVCKRYYTGKDLVRHRFGRLYEIPRQLALLGHQVTVLCFDYRNKDFQERFIEHFDGGFVRWLIIPLPNPFNAKIKAICQEIWAGRPDVVIGSSDIPCLWIARKLASQMHLPYVVDLYDNYESFAQARIPGFRRTLINCIKIADLVVTVSCALKEKVLTEYEPSSPVIVASNGINCSTFYKGDKAAARAELDLPEGKKLIGTAGNLYRSKGLDTVYEAWDKVEKLRSDVCLVLAGRLERGSPIPVSPRVIYLGELLELQVGQLFRALDVGIIPAHDTSFGRYCFPQKLYEMIGCGLPVVAAKVGAIAEVLHNTPDLLFTPGDAENLASVAVFQVEVQKVTGLAAVEWSDVVAGIEPHILALEKRGSL